MMQYSPDMPSRTTIARVADFVLHTQAEAIPDSARDRVALLLLDTLGICIAAAPMQAGGLARDSAVRLYGAQAAEDQARLLFDGRRASVAGAAFAAATQIDNLDGHDGYNPVKGHIGVAVVPALLALSEHRADLSGPDALAALIVGYEIAGRAGMALHATVSDYHTSGAWNALGVAALGCRVRGLSAATLREALGIAEYHGPRSQMMREIANPTMLHDGSGMGALVGLSATVMAEFGFTGAPAITVENPDVASVWADLGQDWLVARQYIKPYPICRWAHAAIDAVRDLRAQHGLAAADIERIEVSSFHNATQLFAGLPETTSQAQYSLPFAVATMLVHGEIGLRHISGDGLADPLVADLVARTRMRVSAQHEARFPDGRWADVSIVLKDGRRLESGDTQARGGPERPFDRAAIVEKYMTLSAPVLGQGRARAICDATLALTRSGVLLSELTTHLYAPP